MQKPRILPTIALMLTMARVHGSACVLAVALAACSSGPATGGAFIGPEGGTITVGDVTASFPPGALESRVEITITQTNDAVPAGYVGYSPVYRFGPRGIAFASPVTISIHHTPAARAASVIWSDSAETTWVELPSTDGSGFVSATVMHFSEGVAGGPELDGGASDAGDQDAGLVDAATGGMDGGLHDAGADSAMDGGVPTHDAGADAASADAGPPDTGDANFQPPSCVAGSGGAPGAHGSVTFAEQFGCGSDNFIADFAVDSAGNIYAIGSVRDTIDFGNGVLTCDGTSDDVFLVKFDPSGHALWSHRYGDAAFQDPTGIAVDTSGNVVIAIANYGTVDFGLGPLVSAGSSDVVLAKFDPAGTPIWQQQFGDADGQFPSAMVATPSGGFAVVGMFYGAVSFGGATFSTSTTISSSFVAAFDAAGRHVWSTQFVPVGSLSGNLADDIVSDATGAVTISGSAYPGSGGSGIDFGLGTVSVPSSSSHTYQPYIVHLDPSGHALWSHVYVNCSFDIAIDSLGNVVAFGSTIDTPSDFAGSSYGSAGLLLAKFDTNGATVFSEQFPYVSTTVVGDSTGRAVVLPSGQIDIVGWSNISACLAGGMSCPTSRTDQAYGLFLGQFTAAGAYIAVARFGSPDWVSVEAMHSPNGQIILAGGFRVTTRPGLTLAGQMLTAPPGTEAAVYLASIPP